ncbi:MAG: hypothetical protein Fur003_3010 [Candidatus Dojkabacteria bacterium]
MKINANQPFPKKKNPIKGFLSSIFFLFLIIAAVAFYGYNRYTKAVSDANSTASTKVSFIIERGQSFEEITNSLIDAGLLSEAKKLEWRVFVKLSGTGGEIQAGHFNIPKNLNMKELLNTLKSASIPEFWVTITEGIRIDEVGTILENEFAKQEGALFKRSEFDSLVKDKEYITSKELGAIPDNLEGYLFPDKYLFANDATTTQVLDTIIENYKAKVSKNLTYEDLIIASMVEREARHDEDRQIVAGIIKKRLNEGWLLGIDATLLYYFKDWKHELTYQDLQQDQPYNSRVRIGLTPTPICNPSLSSINAVLNPRNTQYYYYISDKEGNMHYAVDAYGHQQNIQTYLQ